MLKKGKTLENCNKNKHVNCDLKISLILTNFLVVSSLGQDSMQKPGVYFLRYNQNIQGRYSWSD